GWPLTVIMTPDKTPFFAGTYFPKKSRFGRIGMVELSQRIQHLWTTQREAVLQSAKEVAAGLRQLPQDSPGQAPGKELLENAYQQLSQRFDQKRGGFGQAPKFPTPHNMLFLLRHWKRTGDGKALEMVENTLQAMRLGGIYDHVGFGFHRYSTDAKWLVPHFEKMLYDQAMLAMAYVEVYQATRKEEYGKTAREILTYVLRDMTDPTGGFYSAEDADSEGQEGKFYLWTTDQIRQVLEPKEAELVIHVFGVDSSGNFEDEASGRRSGANILLLKKPLTLIASELKISEGELANRLEKARQKLFASREKRIHPHKDDKILTDWNGLMIAALSKASQVFGQPEYSQAAQKSADFILNTVRGPGGRLLHRYRDGDSALPANVDDYAFLIWGLIDLYEATFEVRYLNHALELNDQLLARFWDKKSGGLYFTAEDGEALLLRRKEIYDGAIPSGNSAAALNFLRLARLTGRTDLEQKTEQIGRTFSGNIRQLASAHTLFLSALDFGIGPSYEVVITGNPKGDDTKIMLRDLRGAFLPNKVVLFRPSGTGSSEIAAIAPYARHQESIQGKATAYVCQAYNCTLPTTDSTKMLERLGAKQP
ncbi:MAG: thioredoxin domain-containing protein, partial [Desulfomonile tiedjei]|nr:thioredoxin domain-containing protein [Desulfomonile tiedjei]